MLNMLGGCYGNVIDLTLKVTKEFNESVSNNKKMNNFTHLDSHFDVQLGHLGTHFDVMDKEFPLKYTKREGLVFDVSGLSNKEIDVTDIDMNLITQEMFIAFYTGYIEKELYGTKSYFTSHPQLSDELIEQLIDRKISIIGIDFAGVKRGSEHRITDQYCADRGVFIIENLCNLDKVLNQKKVREFTANTYPLNFEDITGLPCRVVAEIIYAI